MPELEENRLLIFRYLFPNVRVDAQAARNHSACIRQYTF